MKTNDIFDFRRFGKYFASDIRTCAANYGLSLLALTMLAPIATELITAGFSLLLDLTWQGAWLGLRVGVFAIAMLCLVVTMPAKCYGKLTDKQYGAFWLMLPPGIAAAPPSQVWPFSPNGPFSAVKTAAPIFSAAIPESASATASPKY